jgi:ABC-type bacteriocin/lantibiotic exporter with double-glycine peptidase domain
MKKLKVKHFQETLYGSFCGPATLKMILDFYGIHETEKNLAMIMKKDKEVGTEARDFLRAAKKFNLRFYMKDRASFSDIEKWLKKGVPPIVDWFTRGRTDYSDADIADGHYSVVAGLDKNFIYLQDPEIGKMRKLKRDDFLKVWFDFDGKYISSKSLFIRRLMVVYK